MYNFQYIMARNQNVPFNNQLNNLSFYHWPSHFTKKQVQGLAKVFSDLERKPALVGIEAADVDITFRNHLVQTLEFTEDAKPIFNQIHKVVESINFHHYDFELWGMENLELSTFTEGNFFAMHTDRGVSPYKTERKMTCIVSLSDHKERKGGELIISPCGNPKYQTKVNLEKGDVVLMPSWVPYEVTKVTEGELTYINTWITGPKFV